MSEWINVIVFVLQMNWSERGATKRNSLPPESDVSMKDNSLYCGKEAGEDTFDFTQTLKGLCKRKCRRNI